MMVNDVKNVIAIKLIITTAIKPISLTEQMMIGV